MTKHNRLITFLVSFNTIENSTVWTVMPDFIGFVSYCYSSNDTLYQNWKKLKLLFTAIAVTNERVKFENNK